MLLQRYPLDPTGRSPTNLVEGEIHTLDVHTDFRLIFPRNGAYFNDSLIVRQGSKTLQLNKDYLYTFLWHDATTSLGQGVSTALQITNKNLAGDIQITYQVVGGQYQERIESLDNVLSTFPHHTRDVYWDEVRERPEGYWPARHLHHINDVFGLSRLIKIIDDLRRSLEGQSVLKLKVVYDRFLKLKQYVEANLKDVDKIRTELAKGIDMLERAKENFITRDNVDTIVNESIQNTIGPELDTRLAPLIEKDSQQQTEINNLKRDLTQVVNNVGENLQDRLRQIENQGTSLNNRVTGLEADLPRNINTLRQEFTTQDTNLSNRINALQNTVNQKEQQLSNYINDKAVEVRNTLNTNLDTAKAELNGKIDQLKTQTDAKVTDAVNQINQAREQDKAKVNEQIAGLSGKVDEAKQQIDQAVANNTASIDEKLAGYVKQEGFDNRVNGLIDTKVNPVTNTLRQDLTKLNQKVDRNKTTADTQNTATNQRIDGLTNRIDEVNNQSTERDNAIRTELTQIIDQNKTANETRDRELKQTMDSELGSVKGRLDDLEQNGTNREELAKMNERLAEVEARPIPREDFNPDQETINALVAAAVDKRLAEIRKEKEAEEAVVPDVPISRPDEATIRFNSKEENRNYYIQTILNNTTAKALEDDYRTVYAPLAVIEFERTGEWTVPDDYDGTLAQVYVTTALKGNVLPSGKCLVYPPCTKMGYVLLKGGTTIPITVGTISSFGAFLTNDGIDRKGLLSPTYPILMDIREALANDDDIRNYFGKYGRVAIYV